LRLEGELRVVVAGRGVRCRSVLEACLAELKHVSLHAARADLPVDVDYLLRAAGPERFEVLRDGEVVATTAHPENLVTLLQLDVLAAVESHLPRDGLWLHAAALERPRGGCVLLVGASSSGKSTAALLLCRRGYRLIADDVAWLGPGRELRGLGWAIALEELPVDRATLDAEGFVARRQRWRDDGDDFARWRLRPPPGATADALASSRLLGLALLDRGPSSALPLTPGQLLVGLWPQRIARADGVGVWTPSLLADALAPVPAARMRSSTPESGAALIDGWATGLADVVARR
jgi:hypothetical protein